MFDERGAVFDPVSSVDVRRRRGGRDSRRVNVSANDAVAPAIADISKQLVLEVTEKRAAVLALFLIHAQAA